MKRALFAGMIIILTLSACGKLSTGVSRNESFKKPDIKDEYCGAYINFQYCKCAFHNEYCDQIGMSKGQANKYVNEQYDKWLETLLLDFETNCRNSNGFIKNNSCNYCDSGFMAANDACINDTDIQTEDEKIALPDGPYNEDCSLKQDEFESDWKKYSDIDNVIAPTDRSYEAQQALAAYDEMIDLMAEGFGLERDIELENQMQAELENYRQALVQNIKINLLKSFWRLSWVTYSTIKSGSSLGNSYSSLLTTGATVETIGAGLKVVQGLTPASASLAIDTSSLSGKAKSVGANVALEAIDSLGDPVKIATELVKSSTEATFPSADITPEEIDILRQQHLTKGVISEILAESKATNAKRQARLDEIESRIALLEQEIAGWELKEKDRVAASLVESCQKLTAPKPNSD
jgi:hypothetical protein